MKNFTNYHTQFLNRRTSSSIQRNTKCSSKTIQLYTI